MGKLTDIEIPFFFARKQGQSSILLRIEGDDRQVCESLLNRIEISGDVSNFHLLRLDKYPKEISCLVVIDPEKHPDEEDKN